MRYSLFDNKTDADIFAEKVQTLCDANYQAGPRIIKSVVWIEHLQKWAVNMEYEPDLTGIEVVDSVEPEEMEERG